VFISKAITPINNDGLIIFENEAALVAAVGPGGKVPAAVYPLTQSISPTAA
jgi:hypothetical protein